METPHDNFAEQLKKLKEFLLENLNELRATEYLYREILIRDSYEKLDNDSILIEASGSWEHVDHFITELAKMPYTKGINPEIDLLQSLVDAELERVKDLWEEVKDKYPPSKVIYPGQQPPPQDLGRN